MKILHEAVKLLCPHTVELTRLFYKSCIFQNRWQVSFSVDHTSAPQQVLCHSVKTNIYVLLQTIDTFGYPSININPELRIWG